MQAALAAVHPLPIPAWKTYIDITLALCQDDTDKDISAKERDAIYGNHVLICTTASQLTKVFYIGASILESYVGANSLVAIWYRDWANFTTLLQVRFKCWADGKRLRT